MQSTLALIVDWSGPFASVSDAQAAAAKEKLGKVLYLATGKCKGQHKSRLQYVGISNNLKNRFNDPNHPISLDVTRSCKIWIGQIISHGVAGRRAVDHPIQHSIGIERAEWALAYFLRLPLNKKKRSQPPPGSLILFNRWFYNDFSRRRVNKRGVGNWPDFIEYDRDYDTALLQWFGAPAKRKRLDHHAIKAMAIGAP